MCWETRNKAEKKIAEKDIDSFKIVFARINGNILSVYNNYTYELGSEYIMSEDINVLYHEYPVYYEINEGFHSYDPNIVSINYHKDEFCIPDYYNVPRNLLLSYQELKFHNAIILSDKNDNFFLDTYSLQDGFDVTEKIMRCKIPAGSEYYENEHGEIVSNRIIPISIEDFDLNEK